MNKASKNKPAKTAHRSKAKSKGKNASVSSPFTHVRSNLFWTLVALVTVVLLIFIGKVVIDHPFSILPRFGEVKYPAGDIRGIDVNHYQEDIDWQRLASAQLNGVPVRFVFIKATEGSDMLDSYFNRNFAQAHKQGIICGAYHFFSTKSSAKAQARWFCREVWLDDIDLPPVLDIEQTGGLATPELRSQVLQWLNHVESHYGVTPILYTSYSFKKRYLNTPEFDRYPYWIAHYYVDKLKYTGKWHFWQHSDRGEVDGIDHGVDVNVFNGNYEDLLNMTIGRQKKDD